MKHFLRNTVFVSALFAAPVLFAQASATPGTGEAKAATDTKLVPVLKHGLVMQIYEGKRPLGGELPDWDRIAGIGVQKMPFSPGEVSKHADLKSFYSQALFFVWSGYIKIEKTGRHTLYADIMNNDKKNIKVSLNIYLKGNRLTFSKDKSAVLDSKRKNLVVNADVDLEPGYYRLHIPLECSGKSYGAQGRYDMLQLELKIKEPGGAIRTLTPNDLFYR